MVRDFLYCGGPSIRPSEWLRSHKLFSEGFGAWPQLEGRTVIGTHRGRTAVALACRTLGLGSGHEVLMPAYHCGTELDALLHAGVTPVPYRVTRHCEIDLEDLMARKTDRTRAVYLIHYFGWEQPMDMLRRWCDEHGLLLIEDCALALFSDGQTGAIGKTGDAAIYSLPKSLGLLHGGLLSLSAHHAVTTPFLKPGDAMTWLREIQHSVRVGTLRTLDKLGLYAMLFAIRQRLRKRGEDAAGTNELPDMPGNYYFNPAQDADRSLHQRAAAVATSVSIEKVIQTRRANYSRLAAALDGNLGVTMMFPSLPSGVCPLALPLLVPNRDLLVTNLQKKGIAAFPWWAGFHRYALDWGGFSDACWLKKNLFTLPVDQDMGSRQVDELAAMVISLLRREYRDEKKISDR